MRLRNPFRRRKRIPRLAGRPYEVVEFAGERYTIILIEQRMSVEAHASRTVRLELRAEADTPRLFGTVAYGDQGGGD